MRVASDGVPVKVGFFVAGIGALAGDAKMKVPIESTACVVAVPGALKNWPGSPSRFSSVPHDAKCAAWRL